MAPGIRDFLVASDPLSTEAIDFLLGLKEENTFLDYKESFSGSEKEWLELTRDVMAFANTFGGYLVFGIRDTTFDLVGLPAKDCATLSDTNLVQQKLNRHVAPQFTEIRTKAIERSGSHLAIILVPVSTGRTHVVVREGLFTYPSGERKALLRPGMVYLRRSASNYILDPEAVDFIVSRRLEDYRTTLLDKIARVVESPPGHEILVFDPNVSTGPERVFLITNAPDAMPVKGMSFTVAPATDEQEVASWIALAQKDPEFLPRAESLWRLHAKRHNLRLSEAQRQEMIKFSLLRGVPAFFWMRELDSEMIKSALLEICSRGGISEKSTVLDTAAFLGRGFYNKILERLGRAAERLGPTARRYPAIGPRERFAPQLVESLHRPRAAAEAPFREELERRLNELSEELSREHGGAFARREAQAIDCYLYAREDKYQPGISA